MNEPNYNSNNEWWGHSSEHGWVVLVRDRLPYDNNRTKIFFRSSDWERVEIKRADWDAMTGLSWAKVYLDALCDDMCAEKKSDLLAVQAEFKSKNILANDDLYQQHSPSAILAKRGVVSILHFTQEYNLPNIAKHRLLSRTNLYNQGIHARINDQERYDNQYEFVSCSISWPNWQLFYKHREKTGTNRWWCVLEIDPAALENTKALYCTENAAKTGSVAKAKELDKRGNQAAIKAMFEDIADQERSIQRAPNLLGRYTTSPQAEVLVHGGIDCELIRAVHFAEDHHANWWRRRKESRYVDWNVIVSDKYFGRRSDWKHWI